MGGDSVVVEWWRTQRVAVVVKVEGGGGIGSIVIMAV